MSWTTQHTETNAFKVKNVNEVREVFNAISFNTEVTEDNKVIAYSSCKEENSYFNEDTVVILSKKPLKTEDKETNFVGCVDSYADIPLEELLEENNLDKEDVITQNIVEYLQDQLIEGHAISITDVGFESRCSGNYNPFGGITFITKNTVKYASLSNIQDEMAKELGVEI